MDCKCESLREELSQEKARYSSLEKECAQHREAEREVSAAKDSLEKSLGLLLVEKKKLSDRVSYLDRERNADRDKARKEKETIQKELKEAKEKHQAQLKTLSDSHQIALGNVGAQWTAWANTQVERVKREHSSQIAAINQQHATQSAYATHCHLSQLETLRQNQAAQIEELKKGHAQQLAALTAKISEVERELGEIKEMNTDAEKEMLGAQITLLTQERDELKEKVKRREKRREKRKRKAEDTESVAQREKPSTPKNTIDLLPFNLSYFRTETIQIPPGTPRDEKREGQKKKAKVEGPKISCTVRIYKSEVQAKEAGAAASAPKEFWFSGKDIMAGCEFTGRPELAFAKLSNGSEKGRTIETGPVLNVPGLEKYLKMRRNPDLKGVVIGRCLRIARESA